ncbi:MAG: hypothetical protein B6D58_09220 [candidate division Zixibacteria bacterium 4484_95]|nr:MAG: hypothetical protein B6D58_09220 [candidate division Zixibacteria bacterium 4484_95]
MTSVEAFYECFNVYNTTWFPVSIISWLALIICTYFLFTRPSDKINVLMKICLAFIFIWNGAVFFFMYMKNSAIPGGIPMLAAGILFTVDIFRDKIRFQLPEEKCHKYFVLSLTVWALVLYTLVGWLIGHPYPKGPLPVAPCPMTIFTIALLSTSMITLSKDRIPFTLLFILLLWWAFFAGFGAPLFFGFYVDLTLLMAGIYGLVMLIRNWKVAGK